ncbi:hypothetical protein [Streptomyces mirabilis]|uniref:hypothetical protein n=1 Tax=Streptomyces mirabilis TaxID=68239 RepID=UPI0033F299D5
MRVIHSTVRGLDIDDDQAEVLPAAAERALNDQRAIRETYLMDDRGKKDFWIALVPYTTPSGEHRWAVLDSAPTEADWRDTGELDEAIAVYEEAVHEASDAAVRAGDDTARPLWDFSDVEGIPARERGDSASGSLTALMIDAEWAHEDFAPAEEAYQRAAQRRQAAFARAIDAHRRGGQAALARRTKLREPTVRAIADRGRAQRISLYEDSGGGVYLRRGDESTVWQVVSTLDEGQFAIDAAAWHAGDWAPSENDGQTALPTTVLDSLQHIATWWPGGAVAVVRDETAAPRAGAGGKTS